MSRDSDRWKDATQRQREINEEKAKDPLCDDMDNIKSFINSEDYHVALGLLKETGESIKIGWREGAHSSTRYFLGGPGFYYQEGRGDETNLFTKIYDPIIRQIAEAFRNENKDISFIDFIVERLDDIADNVGK